ncbi:MarR family winged helix-turn-helix transcriptional regulator [Sphingomonas sp. BK235]|uniref:MarR family winged helix-turn-helix transcriptional regulator n=2 Tax=unclassified Sphingomonas TaxID=196159 RepID=UPI00104D0187|nr:MarR family winged helix-turn-helix transcriptional regulator [Sphingomonas sp. BK235]
MTRNRMFDPTSEAFRLATSPFYLIAHADYMYHRNMDAVLSAHGANKAMYRIMTVLRDHQPCRMTDLADMALIKRPTVSRIVERMGELGLVDTAQSEEDSRATDVRMSAAGRALLDTLTPLVAPLFVEATRGLSHDELQRFVATLQIIGSNLAHPRDKDSPPG